MGAIKHEFYSEELITMAELFKALGHPARLKAVIMVANELEADITMDDISSEIGLSKSTLSEHMRKLSSTGIVKKRVETVLRRSYLRYRLNKPALEILNHFISYISTKIEAKKVYEKTSVKNFYAKLKSTEGWSSFYAT